jgi:membrane-bound lytic murein transglycosylase B
MIHSQRAYSNKKPILRILLLGALSLSLLTTLQIDSFSLKPRNALANSGKDERSAIDEMAFRGWGFIAHHLHERGMSHRTLSKIFLDKRVPQFTFVPFAVAPKESERLYTQFLEPERIQRAQSYLKKYTSFFHSANHQFQIPPEVIAAIILIETDLGNFTGNHSILPQLARLANAATPSNILKNYERLVTDGEAVTFQQVQERASYLLRLFLPEVEATVRIARNKKSDPLKIKGSYAGAFGYAQFLPTSFERFAIDGNQDGIVSLFQHPDAIISVARFLSHHQTTMKEDALRQAVRRYNNSVPYVEAVLAVSKELGLRIEPSEKDSDPPANEVKDGSGV